MAFKKSIHIEWDSAGSIRHRISGAVLEPPRNDERRFFLLPSAPFLLAHQFGSMKPSHGIIACDSALDVVCLHKGIYMPINTALRAARIDFIYSGGPSAKVQFHPKHRLFANSDSLEEGVRQLLNNYIHYVHSKFPAHLQMALRTFTMAAIVLYYQFLEEQLRIGLIGVGRDKWSIQFPRFSAQLIHTMSVKYFVPPSEVDAETEEWMVKQAIHLQSQLVELEYQKIALLDGMGMR